MGSIGGKETRAGALSRTRFFEKKRGKKLLLIWASGVGTPQAQMGKSFLVLFFKKEPLSPQGWRPRRLPNIAFT
jgi:hypothetical protein